MKGLQVVELVGVQTARVEGNLRETIYCDEYKSAILDWLGVFKGLPGHEGCSLLGSIPVLVVQTFPQLLQLPSYLLEVDGLQFGRMG